MSYLQACRGRTEGFSPRRRRHFSGGVRVIPEQMPNGNPASTCSESAADRLRKKGAKLRDFPHREPPSRCLECARAPRKTGAPPKGPKMYAMFQRWSRPGTVVAAVIGVLVLTGCQANGGGTLTSPDASCARPVSFGFVFSVPTFGADGTFAGSFHDPCAVVGSSTGFSFTSVAATTP